MQGTRVTAVRKHRGPTCRTAAPANPRSGLLQPPTQAPERTTEWTQAPERTTQWI
jgi:hypothetical protein